MRTHIRTHFDKRVSDLLEAEYMTCITANDAENVVSTPLLHSKSFTSHPSDIKSLGLNHQEAGNRQVVEKIKLNHSSKPTPLTSTSSTPSPPSQEMQDIKVFSVPVGVLGTDEDKAENNNRVNNCSLCNYTSSYGDDIVHHMKLVHKIPEESAEKILTEMNSIKVHSTSKPEEEQSNDYKEPTIFDRKLNPSPISSKSSHTKGVESQLFNNVSSISCSRKKNVNGREARDSKTDGDTEERNCESRSHVSTFDAHKKSYCSATLNNKTTERAETPVQ